MDTCSLKRHEYEGAYPLEELEASYQRCDQALPEQGPPDDGQVVEVPLVVSGALMQLGGGLRGDDLIHRGQDPLTQALEEVRILSVQTHTHTHTQKHTHTHTQNQSLSRTTSK